MSNAFTVLWNNDRVKIAARYGVLDRAIEFLFGGPHTSQPSFIRAGVASADIVYPIFIKNGQIHILAQVVAKRIVSIEEFMSVRPDLFQPDYQGRLPFLVLDHAVETFPWMRAFCWTCSDHVLLAACSSPLRRDMLLPAESLERLTFRSKRSERQLKGVQDGRLTTTLGVQGGVYRLSDASARDFQTLFET